jgi:hypothetical protein
MASIEPHEWPYSTNHSLQPQRLAHRVDFVDRTLDGIEAFVFGGVSLAGPKLVVEDNRPLIRQCRQRQQVVVRRARSAMKGQ